jgi:hypothetical protein
MPAPKKPSRYKPYRTIRIPEPLARQLQRLATTRVSTMTNEAVTMIREALEKLGRWPPRPPGPAGRGR